MRSMTRTEMRGAIVNLDPVQKKIHLPTDYDATRWDRLDYYGWRDLRTPSKVYIVADIDGVATGITLRQSPPHAALGSRAMMCDLCRFTRRFNEVSLFAAPRPSRDKRQRSSTVGLYVCTDLDCADNVNTKPHIGPLDPPVEEIVARRRRELRERTTAFIRSFAEAQQSMRRSG